MANDDNQSVRMVPRLDIEPVPAGDSDPFALAQHLIERHEGYRQFPYKDTRGFTTIGYGRNLSTQGITELEASLLLARDIRDAELALSRFSWWQGLAPQRQAVLLDMAVQLGFAGLLRFKDMLRDIANGNYHLAADAMLSSKAAVETPQRFKENAEIMRWATIERA